MCEHRERTRRERMNNRRQQYARDEEEAEIKTKKKTPKCHKSDVSDDTKTTWQNEMRRKLMTWNRSKIIWIVLLQFIRCCCCFLFFFIHKSIHTFTLHLLVNTFHSISTWFLFVDLFLQEKQFNRKSRDTRKQWNFW